MQTCGQSLRPDLAEPIVVQPYAPDGRRIVFSASNFVLINAVQASCTFIATGERVIVEQATDSAGAAGSRRPRRRPPRLCGSRLGRWQVTARAAANKPAAKEIR